MPSNAPSSNSETRPLDLPTLFRVLNREGVRTVLVGGMAVVFHGGVRFTRDIDLAVVSRPDDRRALTRALVQFSPRPLRANPEGPWPFDEKDLVGPWSTWATDVGRVDILTRLPGIADGFEGLYARSLSVEIEDVLVRIASREDLIAMKEAAGRPLDLEDLRFLRGE